MVKSLPFVSSAVEAHSNRTSLDFARDKRRTSRVALLLAAALLPMAPVAAASFSPAAAPSMQGSALEVPLNKSQVVRASRSFTRALIGNPEIADVLPLSNQSLHVIGKKTGTTTLTLYGAGNQLVQVIDIVVGPDVVSLRRQFADLMPGEKIGAQISNDSIVLTGTASSGPAVDKAIQLASTYAGAEKVVNMLALGASQQVMLEVRFSEVNRQAAKDIGINHTWTGNKTYGSIGNLSKNSVIATSDAGSPVIKLDGLSDAFGVGTLSTMLGGLNLFSSLDALESKGLVKTLAEPTLVALSGETASFLAGGEFPIPVLQQGSGIGGTSGGTAGITIEFKPFGVSLAFTPTVLADGVISLVVAPEVSSIDPTSSVTVGGLTIPGLQTRRAKTTVELRDGQSFALAGLLRNDFRDTVRQLPVLGSLPIIGALFRSSGFQKQETELVIIVTPRLVKPIQNIADVRLPTDRVGNPHELDLFLMGRTDKAVGINPLDPNAPPLKPAAVPAKPTEKGKQGGFSGPTGYEL
jgi:pilus assembly protein CpaC